tara:strand:- start:4858 stop:5685 length:828 start_codon:yes stop_codon:yes gene_type:complete
MNEFKETNLILTNNILNYDAFINFLNIEFCNKEFKILQSNMQANFSQEILKNISLNILGSNTDCLSNYYIKLSHLFSCVFNITSNHFTIQENNIYFDLNIDNCIPEINYIFGIHYDYDSSDFNMSEETNTKYLKYQKTFCKIFYGNDTNVKFKNININNVVKEELNCNKILFENSFENYVYKLTLIIQNIKKTVSILTDILNKHFKFQENNNIVYIENMIPMSLLDDIIAEVRNNIVEYFFKLDPLYNDMLTSYKLFIFEEFYNTLDKRIALLDN